MKYTRLTKEQFEELHQEFINFLATQSITKDEWNDIKTHKPQVAEQELDIFSDLVWEGVLQQVNYLEHFSPQQLHVFSLNATNIHVISIKINADINITTKEGYQWLRENLMHDDVEFLQAEKPYSKDAKQDKFQLIQQGAIITKGELYTYLDNLIN